MVQPCSNAIAACWASATSFPVAPASRHSLSKMSRWSGPGPTMRAVGRSMSEDTNANDWSRVDGGSKILGLVTTRTKPDRTRTERGERFRPRRQTGDPGRILGVFGDGVLDMRIYKDVHIGKQHLESATPMPEAGLVILCIERPRPVQVYSGAGMHTPDGHQLEGRRLRRLATLQSVIQRSGNKGADADASGFGCPTHLLR